MTTTYAGYVGVDVLRSATGPLTSAAAEPSFLMSAQVMEILFDLAYVEAKRARDEFNRDDVRAGLRALRRVRQTQSVLLASWELLRSMNAIDYAEFRDAFGAASGFQSSAYRRFEFILGEKNAALLDLHRDRPGVYEELARVHDEPSLANAVTDLLHRKGIPAWRAVYADRDRHPDTYEIGEALADISDQFARWRSAHLLIVERVLGTKPGSAGTTGLTWLRKAAEHRFFPELLDVA